MPAYRKPNEAVVHYPTKFDECIIRCTGKPYRHQVGSGRAAALAHIVDGMLIGQLTAITSPLGFDSDFVVGSLLKQTGAKDCAYLVEPPEGTTLEAIKSLRNPRKLTPEQAEKREQKVAEQAAKVAEKLAAKEARAAEKAAEKQKAAQRAAEKAAEATAAAAAAAAANGAEVEAAAPAKGKGKGKAKAKPVATEGTSPEAAADASANV
jgi:hypothetical protein